MVPKSAESAASESAAAHRLIGLVNFQPFDEVALKATSFFGHATKAVGAGVKQGDQVVFLTLNELTVMKPAREELNSFTQYAGTSRFETKTEVNAWLNDLQDDWMLSATGTNVISALWPKEPAAVEMTDLLFSAR